MKIKKDALRKDFIMEIRKSMGRFLSIFFIVALGVSLFAGIHATKPDMILSGDAYVDQNRLMDIKVVSTYGLTEEDRDVIGRLPAIETAEGAYSVDALCTVGDNKRVVHVMSGTEEINSITVEEGKLPETANECLVDQDFLKDSGYEIGDWIELESGTDTELTKTLQDTKYRIVGTGNSPLYFALQRGNSTIGNGSVSGFMVVSSQAFVLDVFTEIYARVDGAENVMAFTEDYDVLIDEAIKQIELIQNVRCEIRRNELAENVQLQIDDARNQLNEKKQEAENEISENEDRLDDAELDIRLGKIQIESGKAEIQSAKAELEAGKQELQTTRSIYEETMCRLKGKRQKLEQRLADWEEKLEEQAESVQDTELPENILPDGTLPEDVLPDEKPREIIEKNIVEIRDSIAELEEEINMLTAEFEAKIAAEEQRIAESEAVLKEKEKELQVAEKQLLAGEKEVNAGKEELENAKQEMKNQIQDGEDEINEAEDDISKIELPVWYVFDRSSIPEYSGYGDNAERIAALAIVFPGMFFLVAALISLTTMTRMIEEQRIQIGTLKALGYSKFAIMKKYLNYALLATFSGSLFGVLVGEKIFPYIIIVSYKIMYVHIPHVLLPYHWGYGLAATGIAVACTGAATIFACYKELAAQPAVLMRPEAPKIGKRTLIEKIPFIWKNLNFTWKSSLRNLFRYKKRFFMTLFGIGGCMGLLLVGFGLRDSINSVAIYQYGELHTYDASIFISEDMKGNTSEALERFLQDNKDISSYTKVHMMSITVQNDDNEVDAYLTVIDDVENVDQFFVYRDRVSKKKYELSEEGIILTEKTAKMLGVKAGEKLLISEEGKNKQRVEVTAICENYAGHYVYMTSSLYEKLYGEKPFYNNLLVKSDAETARLEKIGEEILEYEDILNVQYMANLSLRLNDMLGALDKVMIVLITVAGMLSFVVLYNLNNINITERRRELATLKVLGFYDLEVATYVYRENIMLTLLGTLVGCGIGKFLHLFTITTVEVDAAMFGRNIFPMSYLYGALFTIGFSAFVNWIMFFKLKKINMVESLKSVE